MKRLTIMVCALIGLSAYAHAAPALKLENIKQIVCESTVSYDEDSPNEKTAARGVKIFKPGSRKDVKPRPGALAHGELDLRADGTATGFINQKDHITELRCKIHRK
jgi:hypothetical protein